ncbi:MAG: HD domain-containing protein [Pseudonocardia sp.]
MLACDSRWLRLLDVAVGANSPGHARLCSVVCVSTEKRESLRPDGWSSLTSRAQRLSEALVAPLGRRWTHTQAVASRAASAEAAVDALERQNLVAAAWLHDIGYSPEIGHTRFHPLDGARYLRDEGWPEIIVNLVAHHSGARFEAKQRGLADELAEFPFPDGPLLDALALADLTTGPSGEPLTYDERIAEILRRYPEDDPVHQAWLEAGQVLRESVRRAEARMASGSA